MDDSLNKYILEWKEAFSKALTAMENKDFELYDRLMEEANLAYEKYKEDSRMTYECKNFGLSNYIFENALPTLFISNKKVVKEFIKTIKEDKNLLTQFQFYKTLEKYSNKLDSNSYINESLSLVHENIDLTTLNESNLKLGSIISKYGIKPSELISEDKIKFFEDCDFLFKNKKKLNNLSEVNLRIKNISESIKDNHSMNESKKDCFSLIEDFEKKYNSLLNEEEKSFVKEIMDAKSGSNDLKKENLFNKFKNECISIIDTLIKESDEDDKDGLNAIKDQINEKTYCSESLVDDIAKFLEIRDILKEK
ncbi:MAG: hypothetical protein IKV87_08190 [Methanobrevibacter sp.]|nr:hypothetical protein [Methanobrevibacter sp.]MBR6515286.1 hypothetical protein [Bacilli bacterium]